MLRQALFLIINVFCKQQYHTSCGWVLSGSNISERGVRKSHQTSNLSPESSLKKRDQELNFGLRLCKTTSCIIGLLQFLMDSLHALFPFLITFLEFFFQFLRTFHVLGIVCVLEQGVPGFGVCALKMRLRRRGWGV